MSRLTLSNIEETIEDSLTKLNFNVKRHQLIDKSFDVDILATRGGLTVIIDVVQQDILSFDSIAKIETVSSYLQDKFKPISLKKILITTSEEVPVDIEKFARDNGILLLKVIPKVREIRNSINQIDFLRPISRKEISVLEIVEKELKGMEDKDCLSLLDKVEKWYQEGGKTLVARRIKKEIDKLALGG